MMQSRVTDVAGFEIRDHTFEKGTKQGKMLMQEKNKQMNSG